MGFWDNEVNGSFDRMFDFNRDGRLSAAEEAFKYDFLNSFENDSGGTNDYLADDLDISGLDGFDLSIMDNDERRQALEDAGLDPDDYDDYDF